MGMTSRIAMIWLVAVLAVPGCASTGAARPEAAGTDASTLLMTEQQAVQAYARGEYDQAARLYTQMAAAMPAEPDYWYRLANSLVRVGRYNEAELAYRRLLALQPSHARAWHNLGIVRMRQAQEAFAGAVRHSDASQDVFKDSLELSTALFTLVGGDVGEAEPPAAR